MAFATKIKLKGDVHQYRLNPEIKLFTLKDLNFETTRNGNFEYQHALNASSPYLKNAIKIKITINQYLENFKMAIVDGSGLKIVDIFSSDKFSNEKEQFDFLMHTLMLRKVLLRD
ncbi:hypothetical protein BGL34_02205 [Fructilactobacillus lindneri]|uniref:hypothetical protein n=1 Tax=Fructilactobacillus lindneri TaxID=53444 RepID=UPI000D48E2CC|nr:hypothetical protein [Fructilactobacillus lindneri]POH08403.1 hypothetical protein BGL34_02205 [Fructilactobacillus lindneri]